MTMFIKLENGTPIGYAVTEENLRYVFPERFPNTHIFTPKDVEPLGFGIYEFTQVPTPDYPFKAVETTPVKRDNGVYYQTWLIEEMTEEEKIEATNVKATQVRQERDYRLMRTDWTQMPDAPISEDERAVWLIYRQSLRDIPQQPGFPWNVEWLAAPARS